MSLPAAESSVPEDCPYFEDRLSQVQEQFKRFNCTCKQQIKDLKAENEELYDLLQKTRTELKDLKDSYQVRFEELLSENLSLSDSYNDLLEKVENKKQFDDQRELKLKNLTNKLSKIESKTKKEIEDIKKKVDTIQKKGFETLQVQSQRSFETISTNVIQKNEDHLKELREAAMQDTDAGISPVQSKEESSIDALIQETTLDDMITDLAVQIFGSITWGKSKISCTILNLTIDHIFVESEFTLCHQGNIYNAFLSLENIDVAKVSIGIFSKSSVSANLNSALLIILRPQIYVKFRAKMAYVPDITRIRFVFDDITGELEKLIDDAHGILSLALVFYQDELFSVTDDITDDSLNIFSLENL